MDLRRRAPTRNDQRTIIHFDYDCFYASVLEVARPELKSLPLGVQQKQIIVTCNYEARRRGLHKLQLITDAKRICPDVVIVLGEDISQFRDASKELYGFIKSFSWNHKVERLGFDEVFMDVSDIVNYNQEILNRNDLSNSFFQTSREDPTAGFQFDGNAIAGHTYPHDYVHAASVEEVDELTLRLRLGSHLALHIRHQLEEQKGYTCTVGIATDKLLSKLAGNLNKPKGQTTVMPPLIDQEDRRSNVTTFIDNHDIGKIPGIGFKLSQKLRDFFLKRPAEFDKGLVYGGTRERVTVADVRNHPEVNPEMLERLLAGPGSPHGIGEKIWCLLHGVDDTAVSEARVVPRQISIEDSYIRLDTMPELVKELTTLARSLISRMRIDLLGSDDDCTYEEREKESGGKRWLAHPKTVRLTTRPRQPLQPDGTRVRSFKRISHSGPLPNFVFNLSERVENLADKLVKDSLLTMFRKLHPEKAGWNLSLVNLAVTNMAETASDSKSASGRDIKGMFNRQEDVLKDFRLVDDPPVKEELKMVEDAKDVADADEEEETGWDDGEGEEDLLERCDTCGLSLPAFAMAAHARFHIQ